MITIHLSFIYYSSYLRTQNTEILYLKSDKYKLYIYKKKKRLLAKRKV